MADAIDYQIFGDDMQLVEVELDPGEAVRAEAGAMTYMEDGIEMQTSTGGGLFKGLTRMVTGESFFITSFVNGGQGKRRDGNKSAHFHGGVLSGKLDVTQPNSPQPTRFHGFSGKPPAKPDKRSQL